MSQTVVEGREINEASVTEWSKVLRSGRSVFARVGSSPTACIFPFQSSIESMTQYIRNCQEVLYYDAVYALAVKDDADALSGKSAVSFLKKSGLSGEDIKKVG